jgi:hypothetical protein
MLESSNQECSCLAGSGLRLAGDVAAEKRDRQRAGLNRRGKFEARVGDAGTDAVVYIQSVESELAQMAVSH